MASDTTSANALVVENTDWRRVQAVLDDSEARLSNIIKNTHAGYFFIDRDGCFQSVNDAWLRMHGYDSTEEVIGQHFSITQVDSDINAAAQYVEIILNDHPIPSGESSHRRKDGSIGYHTFSAHSCVQAGEVVGLEGFIIDVTELKLKEYARAETARLIQLVDRPGDLHECMSALADALQGWTGCEAVGIRLRAGADYPYFETRGFPSAFVHAENHLCAYDADGTILCDGEGNPVLECMCGNILCGRFDPTKPFFTAYGSFCSNNTTALLDSTTEADRQARIRNRCNGEGYESVALIPLRSGDQVFGLLQFNAHRPDRFTPTLIECYEEMAERLALSLSKRQIVEELNKSEERYRRITEGIADYLYTVRIMNGHAVETIQSPACETVTGYTPEEFAADPYLWINMVVAADRDLVRNHLQQLLSGSDIPPIEHRIIRKDGQVRWVRDTIIPFKSIAGKYTSYDGLIQDITERKRAEEALRKSEETLRMVFNNAPIGLILTDCQGVVIDCNQHFSEIFGAHRQDYTGMNLLTSIQESAVRQNLLDTISDDKLHHFEGPYTSILTGKELYLSISGQKVAPDLVITIINDITKRKHIEESLRESNERFSVSFNNAPIMFTISNLEDGTYLDVNQRFLDVSGFSREEVIGKTSVELGWIAETDRELLKESMLRDGDVRDFELTLHAKSGQLVLCKYWGEVITASGQKRLLSIALDISAQRRIEQQLQQAQKMESVGRLAGGVAHDFNNMLTVILGHAELGLMRLDPTNPVCTDLSEISIAAKCSTDLTRQLLAFARKQTVAPKMLDLNDTVTTMLKMLQRLIGEDIHLTWQPAPDLWQVKVDPSQIDQILANLCVNARDAIENTGRITIETANITICADYCAAQPDATAGEYVRLTLSDDGRGMDKETQSHIFEPFFTTKELGKGTGLGLATVFGAVKQNNGFINIDSEPGQGTTFSIYLPRHGDKDSQTTDMEGAVVPVPHGQETILLVEDEPAILEIASLILDKLGYTVLAACTPGDAIKLAQEHSGELHLLMTDVIMPEMNGRELATVLMATHSNLKGLFMSGYTADVIAHHGVLDEGVHFIQKPFSLPDLAAKVREVLDCKTQIHATGTSRS